MTESVLMVKTFHEMFEHPVGSIGTKEPKEIRSLRIKLLFEELEELAEAGDVKRIFYDLCEKHTLKVESAYEEMCSKELKESEGSPIFFDEWLQDGDNNDLVEEADALADLQYVLDGKKLTSGLYEVMDKVFEAVHLNNMKKAHNSMFDAHFTAEKRKLEDGWGVVQKGDSVFILLNKDKKVIKPWEHGKVDLKPLVFKTV